MAKKEEAMIVANDLGYSSIKANVDDEYVYQPTVVSEIREAYQVPNEEEFEQGDSATDVYMDNFLEHIDVSISSKALGWKKTGSGMTGRYLVGNATKGRGIGTEGMNFNMHADKSTMDIPLYVTLAVIAAKKVKEVYQAGGDIFKPISAKVKMATALPISEASSKEKVQEYIGRYMDYKHQVTFNNFADPIVVTLEFADVYVGQEGAIAHLTLVNAPQDLKDGIEEDLEEHYGEKYSQYVDRIIEAPNSLTIDIGQGTTDFSTGIKNRIVEVASKSISQGYGSVLEDARAELASQNLEFRNTEELMSYLQDEPEPWLAEPWENAKKSVEHALEPLARRINQEVTNIASGETVNGKLSVIFVYGGGAVPMDENSTLRQRLEETQEALHMGPIVFIPAEYAQRMNLMGLEIMAQFRFQDNK